MSSENPITIPDKIVALTNSTVEGSFPGIRDQLILLINELINKDFASLVQLLYKIDIDEKKLKQLLKSHIENTSATIIADLIIERQIQKIKTKEQFSHREKPPPEDSW